MFGLGKKKSARIGVRAALLAGATVAALGVVTHHVVPARQAELRAAYGQGSRVVS
jgi:hypothetical protein